MKFFILPPKLKEGFLDSLNPLVRWLVRLDLNPNWFTTFSLLVGAASGVCYGAGRLRWGGALVLLCGLLDTLDGKVARATNRVTRFGALYDSTLDRYAEVIAFFGMAFYFVARQHLLVSVAICVALAGSLMVSYVRARAEGLGFECKVGLMQRPERLVLVGLGSLVHEYALIGAIFIIAVLSNFTAAQRLHHVWAADKVARSQSMDKPVDTPKA
ncbi:MAG: CDP-alcohol phosphatidyltransferase family protein [candidate division KSB1 bacterium]|nr:CDP-alcohol phosphatidyltransferase family protein [candidate division KSB1 bacterium]